MALLYIYELCEGEGCWVWHGGDKKWGLRKSVLRMRQGLGTNGLFFYFVTV